MAQVINFQFGGITGKMGDIVFFQRNGKTFARACPVRYKMSNTEESQNRRDNFAAATRFSKFVNSIPELKEIWGSINVKGTSPYNKIMKFNIKLTDKGKLTLNNIITPDEYGNHIKINETKVYRNRLISSFEIFEQRKLIFPLKLLFVFYFDNETFFLQRETILSKTDENRYSVKINLGPRVKEAYRLNRNPIIYAAVIGTQTEGKECYWTSTAAVKL